MQDDKTPNEMSKTAMRMMQLSQRAIALGSKVQAQSVAKATGSEYSLMDASTLSKSYAAFWSDVAQNPAKLVSAQLRMATGMFDLWGSMLSGGDAKAPRPDRRFADEAWSEDAVSKAYRDTFLVFEKSINDLMDDLGDAGNKDHVRVGFFTRQAISALSPANYLGTNVVARSKFLETNGESLLDGIQNLLDDLEKGDGRLALSTNDSDAFEVGVDLATTKGEVIYQNDLMQLIQYHPTTEKQHKTPMLLVPSWINKFYIMDMRPHNSLVQFLLDQGHTVFMISWANPTEAHAELDFADYMKLGPLTALDTIRDITGEDKSNVLGFCIGGILVTSMLGYLAATGQQDRVNTATTLATMVDFEDVGEIGVFVDDNRLEVLREHMEKTGYLEAHHLQDMFSMLRENDLIWSFFDRNYLRGDKPAAFDLLYWNSDSTRLPKAMLLWYLEQVYLQNKLRQPGGLTMDGVQIDISKVETPCFILATEDDHIAPWSSIYPATALLSGEVEFILGGSGHIAGVINPPAKRMKYGYRTSESYPDTPDGFLAFATAHEGSWWPYWAGWLDGHGAEMVTARKPAKRGRYKSIEPAPGSFVKAP